MAFNLSRVAVIGRLAADGEVRQLEGGKSVCNARVAANVKLGKKEITSWFSFSIWDKFAEVVGPKLKKGGKIYVDGTLALEEYKTKDGELRQGMVIYADQVIVLDDNGSGSSDEKEPWDNSPFARK